MLIRRPHPATTAALLALLALPWTPATAASAVTRGGLLRPPARGSSAQPGQLSPAQAHYLALAQEAVVRAQQRFRDARRGWYDARLRDRDRFPLATIWDIVPLFESLDAIAIAQPDAHNRTAVERFAAGAERYLNRGLRPLGFSPYPGDREPGTETWFDDNGWWGTAFVNAYLATGVRRYLADAQRALRFIATRGWDPRAGGIWWNTHHPYKAGEALASATLLATLLYQQTRSPFALGQAQKYLAWANTSGFSAANGLYAASNINATPIDYIEAPLIYAQALLCRLTNTPALCERAELLKHAALDRFGYLLDFSPQYDAIYLQWMLALYALDGDRTLYEMAADNARVAQTRALNGEGLYLLSWNGEALPPLYALPGMLQTHAATTSVFAWLAVYPPPS